MTDKPFCIFWPILWPSDLGHDASSGASSAVTARLHLLKGQRTLARRCDDGSPRSDPQPPSPAPNVFFISAKREKKYLDKLEEKKIKFPLIFKVFIL